jgi:general L-amino acid transport system substrate-binding protein
MNDMDGDDVKSARVKPNNPTEPATIAAPATSKQEKGQNETKILNETRDSKEGEDSSTDNPKAVAAASTKKKESMTDKVKPPSSPLKDNENKKSAPPLAPGIIESLRTPSYLASLHKRASSEMPPTSQIERTKHESYKGGLKLAPARSESHISTTAVAFLSQDKKTNPSSSGLATASRARQNYQYPFKGTLAVAPGAVASLPQDDRAKNSGLSLAPGVEPSTSASVEQAKPKPSIAQGPGAHSVRTNGFDTDDSGSHHSLTAAAPQPPSSTPRHDEVTDEEQPIVEAQAVEDAVVGEAVPVQARLAKKMFRILLLLLLVTLSGIGLVAFVFGGRGKDKQVDLRPTDLRPTLKRIREQGFLTCGVQEDLLGFSMIEKNSSKRVGFEVDMCRAMAAAVFGKEYSTDKVRLVTLSLAEQWSALMERKIDLVTRTTTYTMERDVYQRTAGVGFTFSVPYMYDGMGFAGIPPYVACADNLQVTGEYCSNLTICTIGDSTHWDTLSALLPASRLVVENKTHSRMKSFKDGACKVVAGESKDSSEAIARNADYTGDYVIGTAQYTKEPLALVTRENDAVWSRFVDLVLQALMEAEVQNVTQETANLLSTAVDPAAMFGVEYQDMFVHAIRAVGNYGEMYTRHLGKILPRKLVNTVLRPGQDTGLRYALPFGSVQEEGPGASPGKMLEQLNRQGYLRCGIPSENNVEGSLDWQYCRALSASVFSGMVENIEYKPFDDPSVGTNMLQNREVDVLSGASAREATRDGLTLSPPYYFYKVNDDDLVKDAVVFATRSDDPQWSDFVFWLISGTTYAEEKNILRQEPNEMPTVELFGPSYKRIFRDAILVVGNAGEMFTEAANSTNSSSALGINALNNQEPRGPQLYPFL